MTHTNQRVVDLMHPVDHLVRDTDDIMRAIRIFVDEDISGMPVVDHGGNLVGIITERDCLRSAVEAGYFDDRGGLVGAFMTHKPVTVAPADSLMSVAQLFVDSPFRRAPVVDNTRLVGVIARRDLLTAVANSRWFSPGA